MSDLTFEEWWKQRELNFEKWWKELQTLIDTRDFRSVYGPADKMDQECWREFWDEGQSPSDALDEDLSNAML